MDLRGAQQAAIAAFQRGDLAGAEQICRDILGRVVQTQQMLGVILAQKGDLSAALTALDAALEISPNAHHIILNRGNTLLLLRRYESALQNFDRVLALMPNDAAMLLGRGSALEGLGRLEDAIQSYEKILESDPDSADAACSCGYAYLKIGESAKALGRFERVLETQPSSARALNGKGLGLDAQGQHREAVSMMEMAIKASPGFAEAWTNRGNILREMGELRLSVESYRQALHLKPKDPTALLGQSLALWYDDDYETALKLLDDLLMEYPLHAEAWSRRGLILRDLGRMTEALNCHDRAIELEPAQPDFCINKAYTALAAGQLREGFRLLERRKYLPGARGGQIREQPIWTGAENLDGKIVHVQAEAGQGLGDTIQLYRYVILLASQGARVILSVQDALVPLLQQSSREIEVVGFETSPPKSDFYISLFDLPQAFATDLQSVPNEIPYINASEDRAHYWRSRIGDHGFKVGVAWRGRQRLSMGKRSFPAACYKILSSIPGARLIGIQKAEDDHSAFEAAADAGIELPNCPLDTEGAFLDTAAIMSSLDLVISPDTAVAHLAGALGRPTWVVLKSAPDWRWLPWTGHSAWYPTLRLYRQEAPGDWESIFHSMAEHLSVMVPAQGRTSI